MHDTDPDRLTCAPRQAMTCANCGCPMLPPRCVCGWVDPDSDADDTDLFDDEASGEQP